MPSSTLGGDMRIEKKYMVKTIIFRIPEIHEINEIKYT
jgi:hypothetical protein